MDHGEAKPLSRDAEVHRDRHIIAALVMQALISRVADPFNARERVIAEFAVSFADALIAALSSPPTPDAGGENV